MMHSCKRDRNIPIERKYGTAEYRSKEWLMEQRDRVRDGEKYSKAKLNHAKVAFSSVATN